MIFTHYMGTPFFSHAIPTYRVLPYSMILAWHALHTVKMKGVFKPARVISVAAALPNYADFIADFIAGSQYQWKLHLLIVVSGISMTIVLNMCFVLEPLDCQLQCYEHCKKYVYSCFDYLMVT